ncbi:MAG: Fic family protein [Actinomycetota bacterium]|nr:Fic family protein [Actinomycetota bacterium]
MAYIPQFNRYPPDIVDRLMRIAAARTVINGAHILPAQVDELRRKALVGTIHYSTLIEGNELPIIEAERAARGELEPTTKAKRELVNYVKALEWIDERFAAGKIVYTGDFLKQLHGIAMQDLGVEGTRFAPEHEGEWRPDEAVVGDSLGTVYHAAPPAEEVPRLVDELCAYLERKRAQGIDYPGPILAGVAHYELTNIHPFADGNGRVARLFALAVLFREGYVTRRVFSAERYYASDKERYYQALRSVTHNTNNMEEWLLYFTDGLTQEFESVAERVRALSALTQHLERTIQLNRNQEQAVAALTTGDRTEIGRADYEELTGIKRSQAKDDLAELVAARIFRRVGSGPNTRYRLAIRGSGGPRGPARKWTDERIRSELQGLLAGRRSWPTPSEFEAAGKMALYRAASRRGGIERWVEELGLDAAE